MTTPQKYATAVIIALAGIVAVVLRHAFQWAVSAEKFRFGMQE